MTKIETKIKATEEKIVKLQEAMAAFKAKNDETNPELVKKRQGLTDKKVLELIGQIDLLKKEIASNPSKKEEKEQPQIEKGEEKKEKSKATKPTSSKTSSKPTETGKKTGETQGRVSKYSSAQSIIDLIKENQIKNLSHMNDKFYGAYAAMVRNGWKEEVINANAFTSVQKQKKDE